MSAGRRRVLGLLVGMLMAALLLPGTVEVWVDEGGHTWPNWRLYLAEFAPKLFPVSRRINK